MKNLLERVKNISINEYTYSLPNNRIAQNPLDQRDQSKLLVYSKGRLQEDTFQNLDAHLTAGQQIIFNDSRVVYARLKFPISGNKSIEVFCLAPEHNPGDMQAALSRCGNTSWVCLVGGARKWKTEWLEMRSGGITLQVRIKEKVDNRFVIQFQWTPEKKSFHDILETFGHVPLPPYITREDEEADQNRYQTVYANKDGSVAAPTAGLHFTDEVLGNLRKKGIEDQYLTLHVGAGTFFPVKAERIGDHTMHSEWMVVDRNFLRSASLEKPWTVVGTTALRALETMYWLGVKAGEGILTTERISLSQWEPYQLPQHYTRAQAFEALKTFTNDLDDSVSLSTQLLIAPGYKIRTADRLITNFHQPGSTLLLLVAAAAGNDWKNIYDYALGE
jgi:S-adenosylmethionine:tRNA ribosyltransferase-isomerase